ncbi:hypothetical protein [Amycolatopsis sp. lyj-23]|uniref:hypothetical protein n=1 Tax=Amycolatopsis sp. lyj-23 TaxID=2789283 RepID=UPI00397DC1CD
MSADDRGQEDAEGAAAQEEAGQNRSRHERLDQEVRDERPAREDETARGHLRPLPVRLPPGEGRGGDQDRSADTDPRVR